MVSCFLGGVTAVSRTWGAYALISMVRSATWSGLGGLSSGSGTAAPRLRDPSLEPTLEAE